MLRECSKNYKHLVSIQLSFPHHLLVTFATQKTTHQPFNRSNSNQTYNMNNINSTTASALFLGGVVAAWTVQRIVQ